MCPLLANHGEATRSNLPEFKAGVAAGRKCDSRPLLLKAGVVQIRSMWVFFFFPTELAVARATSVKISQNTALFYFFPACLSANASMGADRIARTGSRWLENSDPCWFSSSCTMCCTQQQRDQLAPIRPTDTETDFRSNRTDTMAGFIYVFLVYLFSLFFITATCGPAKHETRAGHSGL